MTFLPEDDQLFLGSKQFPHELKTEAASPGSQRHAVILLGFTFTGNLFAQENGALVSCVQCDVLILIPSGYGTTKLDSFYTDPRLKRPNGSDPDRASGEQEMFGRKWQFWSRHLDDAQWRPGVDGLETFLLHVRDVLRAA